jgi:cobalt-zinc-cadmium efflux system membrane fusion protein
MRKTKAPGIRAGRARVLLAYGLALVLATCSRDRPHSERSQDTVGKGTGSPGNRAGGDADTMSEMPGMPKMLDSGPVLARIFLTAAQIRHGHIRWVPVEVGTAGASSSVPGQVVPNEDRTARLGAPAAGRVVAVRVSPGDQVKTSQVLVTLQSPEAGTAQADLAKAEAEVTSRRAQATYAKSARERAERLLALKAIPRQDYERAVADDELARSAFAQAEAEVQRARSTAATLGASSSAGGQITLRSPFNGVVLARTAVPGTVVEAGAPLVVVTDPSKLWLTISAPEAMAGLFRTGGRLGFVVPAYPTDTFRARIEAVGAGLDPETRTLPVRGSVDNSSRQLKPEMLATVTVDGPQEGRAAMVLAEAVQMLEGRPTVFVAEPDGKGGAQFTGRQVQLGPRTGNRVAVTAGLTVGDLAVVEGAFAVKAQIEKGNMPEMEM